MWAWRPSCLSEQYIPKQPFVPLPNGCSKCSLTWIGQVVLEKMYGNNGHIHVYSPGAGADKPLESEVQYEHKHVVTLVICCKFSH